MLGPDAGAAARHAASAQHTAVQSVMYRTIAGVFTRESSTIAGAGRKERRRKGDPQTGSSVLCVNDYIFRRGSALFPSAGGRVEQIGQQVSCLPVRFAYHSARRRAIPTP